MHLPPSPTAASTSYPARRPRPAILVSACLLGEAVRYDGHDKRCDHAILQRWLAERRIVSLCPELAGGLPVPRPAAEIADGAGGEAVLAGRARVIDVAANDISAAFVAGARQALARAMADNIRIAVLKEGSPSCGTALTYDGSFSGRQIARPGVTAALLRQAGLLVFSELQLAEADTALQRLEATGDIPPD
jgi:uncharacterized protein YbbK (DUF523 family)